MVLVVPSSHTFLSCHILQTKFRRLGVLGKMGAMLVRMVLPTVSCLAFLPTISIAAHRRFHLEAMVYFFTMFFISFYHICDGLGFISICIMRSELLEYFSTFGISLSIWVTLIAVGEFQEPAQLGTILAGTLIIAVRTYENSWGYGVYAGPIITAIILLSIKFGRKMVKTRAVVPQKRVYTHQLAPGLCFLILAFTLRFYFQNWDYTYVHSAFHCSLAAACVLLLPEKNKSVTANRPPEQLTCCTLCCCG
uniref:Myomaker, myoblast fusion factor n=1 Tax=Eptatretus burgeri TaxID=7764 RepID=A0A8C4Q420_EPTBU